MDRALRVLVEGVSSPSRGPGNYRPYPTFIDHGHGGSVFDVDGNEYVDVLLGNGSLIHGHAHPTLVAAANEAFARGGQFSAATEIEVELAERITRVVPGAERVRFASTGTEAAMAAVRLARGYTGKAKIIKFEGHYHGWSDSLCVGANPADPASVGVPTDPIAIPDSSGLTRGSLEDTILAPWNDANILEAILRRYRGQVAAVITEPVMANSGVIPPAAGYLEAVRALTTTYEALLIVDETVTGFRLALGGGQSVYGVTGDIATFGKALGAGLPVAALTGRADIFSSFERGGVLHYGTHNGNPILLSVANASVKLLEEERAFDRLNGLGARLADGLRSALSGAKQASVVQQIGSMLQVFFLKPGWEDVAEIRDYRSFISMVDRDAFKAFATAMMNLGVNISPSALLHSVLCTAHTERDVDAVIAAAKDAVSSWDVAHWSHWSSRE
jgi:glutamate-1-semialdehyde 2,1-aminomutase